METIRLKCPSVTKPTVIEPNIFSYNLEHTRGCVFYGLSAQLLRNRKFAGKPACCSGEAADWYRIGNNSAYLTLDRFDSYTKHTKEWAKGILQRRNECNSQVVQNPSKGVETGIGQNNLPIFQGKKYEIRTVIKTNSDDVFSVEIRLTNVLHNIVYAQKCIVPPQHEWYKVSFEFLAKHTDNNACFEIVTRDRGEMKIGVVSLIPTENFRGLRLDVIENLKRIKPSVLRWPGGNFAGEYYWKDGLLDVDERGPSKSVREIETHPYTHGFDFHEMAIDDFIALCRLVGAKPYLTINIGRDSAEECAEFVEYCNGDENTKWGRIRISRGYTTPYHVKYWSLGNEIGFGHMEGPNTPSAYVATASEYAKAMRKVDPKIIFFSSGAYNPERDYSDWINLLPVIKEVGIQYISYHNYLPRIFEGGANFVTDKGLRNTYSSITSAPEQCLQNLEMLREKMDAVDCRKVSISYDEWNLYFAWYHDPGVIEGIYTALMFELFCKNCNRLNTPMVMYFQAINEGAIIVKPGYSELSANGQIMELMSCYKGTELCICDTDNKKLHCLAAYDSANKYFILTVINTAYKESTKIKFEEAVTIEKAILFEGSDLNNGSRFQIKTLQNEQFYDIPAHSVMQFILTGNYIPI